MIHGNMGLHIDIFAIALQTKREKFSDNSL